MTKLSALAVWTEIYSVIKGNADTYRYEDCIIPYEVYTSMVSKSGRKVEAANFLTL